MSPKLIKKEKGIALLLTIVVLIALSTMSIALLSVIQTSAKNTARSHRSMVANQAAEYGIEVAKIDLTQDLIQSTEILTNDKSLLRSGLALFTKNCFALHGYTDNPIDAHILDGTEVPASMHRIYYTIGSNDIPKWDAPPPQTQEEIAAEVEPVEPTLNAGYADFADEGMSFSPTIMVDDIETETDPLFEDYEYIYLTQRVPVDTALANYNFITQRTYDEDLLSGAETWDTQRVYYRVISCGFAPGKENDDSIVVPLQAYYSTGGKTDETYFVEKSLIFTGYYRP